jgi:hypothetical protein
MALKVSWRYFSDSMDKLITNFILVNVKDLADAAPSCIIFVVCKLPNLELLFSGAVFCAR